MLATFLFLSLPILAFTSPQVYVDYGDPTYVQLCFESFSKTVTAVDLSLYNWDVNFAIDKPVRQWVSMTRYADNCFKYGVTTQIGMIYVPASMRITANDSQVVELANFLESISTGASLPCVDFNDTHSYHPPYDPPLDPENGWIPFRGGATAFELESGACKFQTGSQDLPVPRYAKYYAAIREQQWSVAQHCGECIRITNNDGVSIEAMIVDECPKSCSGCPVPNPCARKNWLDISTAAFNVLGQSGWGVVQVSWQFVPCNVSSTNDGMVKYAWEPYSKSTGFEIQIRNLYAGLRGVAIRTEGTSAWTELVRTDYNTWKYDGLNRPLDCSCQLQLRSTDESVVDTLGLASGSLIQNFPKMPQEMMGYVQFSKFTPPPPTPPDEDAAVSTCITHASWILFAVISVLAML